MAKSGWNVEGIGAVGIEGKLPPVAIGRGVMAQVDDIIQPMPTKQGNQFRLCLWVVLKMDSEKRSRTRPIDIFLLQHKFDAQGPPLSC